MKNKQITATLTLGQHKLTLATKRVKFSTSREVRSSDTGDGGKGTLLRVDSRNCRMTCHEVLITGNRDRILLRCTYRGASVSVTKTMKKGLKDIDLNKIADKPESYSMRQAIALLTRMFQVNEQAAQAILAPLEEETEVVETAETEAANA